MYKNVILFSFSHEMAACCSRCFAAFVTLHVASGVEELHKLAAAVRPDCIFIDVRCAASVSAHVVDCLYCLFSIPVFYVTCGTSNCRQSDLGVKSKFFFLPEDMARLNSMLHGSQLFYDGSIDEASLGMLEDFGGDSEAVKNVRKQILVAAGNSFPVLLLGESGTGKTLAASMIHRLSHRRKKIFYRVNIASVSPSLAESELFGTVPGAFTGSENRCGYFSSADGGSLFLDEIGEIDSSVQSKLLQVLENGSYRRVGSDKELHADVRFIFATNADLKAKVRHHQFREDLLYRVSRNIIRLPPLRDRMSDVPHLCSRFLKQYGKTLSSSSVRLLQTGLWPGNIRQLYNCLERAVIQSQSLLIEPEEIFFD